MIGEYRIVVSMDGKVCVQRNSGQLMTQYHPCYLCVAKDEEGYREAKRWIEKRTKEGGGEMKPTCETCVHYNPEWINVGYGDWSYCEYWHADRRSGETCERHEPKEGGDR